MPTEHRPLDHVLVSQVGKPEEEVAAWWKTRFEQIAAIPSASARAGAVIPGWRELADLPEAQRLALTKARILGFDRLSRDQQDRVMEARAIGTQVAPDIAGRDTAFLREKVLPALPAELASRIRARLDRP